MDAREMAKYAAKVSAGVMVEEELIEIIGDDSIVSEIMALSGAAVVVGVASEVIDDTVDTVLDIVDDLNPFSGW